MVRQFELGFHSPGVTSAASCRSNPVECQVAVVEPMDGAEGTCSGRTWPGWSVTLTQPQADASPAPDLEALDERALVAACVDGTQGAFDLVVTRHRRTVYQVCYRFVGTHEDAADLTQEVFLRAYRSLGRFKGDSALATWLYRISVNVALNKVGSRKPGLESLEGHVLRSREAGPAERLATAERAAQVRRAVARLPRRQRTTLILRVYQDLPHREIARILGTSVGAAKANFFHALNNLRKLLGREP